MIFAKRNINKEIIYNVYNLHYNAKNSRMFLRTKIIILSWQEKPVAEIAGLTGLSPTTVGIWIRRFNRNGIHGLYYNYSSKNKKGLDVAIVI